MFCLIGAVPYEGFTGQGRHQGRVITRLHKRIKNLTDEQEQYKSAFCTLNQEVKELREKLEEEGHQMKEQEAKAMVEKELTTLFE